MQTQIFAANPISGAWNPLKPSLQINYGDFAIAVAGMSLVFDVMVLCFPLPVIKNLHMGTRRKVIIASIFWLGALCVSNPLPSSSPLKRTLLANASLIELVVAALLQLSGFGSCIKKFSLYRARKAVTDTVKIPSPPHQS